MSQTPPTSLSFTEDLAAARRARDEGDAIHAAFHTAWALSVRPNDPEALAMAESLFGDADDPRDLVPLGPETAFALVALRARALARMEDYTQAIESLLQVVAARPDISYVPWAIEWARKHGERVDPRAGAEAVRMLLSRLDDYAAVLLPSLIEFVEALRTHHREHSALALIHVRLLRQHGEMDAALNVAQYTYTHNRTPEMAAVLAATHRARGERERAIAMLHESLTLDPRFAAAWLDLGDMSLDTGDFSRAANAYESALAIDEDMGWAKASLLYARYQQTGEREYIHELEDYAHAHGENERARVLLDASTPYVGYVPDPQESSIQAIFQILRDIESGSPLPDAPHWTLRVSALEAPSVRLVLDQVLRLKIPQASIAYEVDHVPHPTRGCPATRSNGCFGTTMEPRRTPGFPRRLPIRLRRSLLWRRNGLPHRHGGTPPAPSPRTSAPTMLQFCWRQWFIRHYRKVVCRRGGGSRACSLRVRTFSLASTMAGRGRGVGVRSFHW
ncbi:tetratricopeptide repeat protein [Pendulispora brunnea]|uniref:Tetratricopeptide repeat protein n=1 Tax=Pendulispora brunnea TaxID=2905690 RepID=A0ABZ2KHE7_9BACT